jgi:hypothetical protein
MQIILAGVAFVVLFGAWVVLPSRLRKRHENNETAAEE